MANRHLSRSIALQALFEWDFSNKPDKEIDGIISRITPEFAPGMGDMSFVRTLASNILKKRTDLDNIIEKAAPDWPIAKISIVDRNILRLGLYELLFSDRKEVPAKVAINEAIELAKTFGGETSGKFVNGVLGAVYKEMGEPGKDEQSTKKHRQFKNVPYDQMPIETLGGAVVYVKDQKGEVYLALVHDVFGHWTLSKGGLESDEEPKAGTEKQVEEEIGIKVSAEDELAKNEYIATHPEKGKIRKQVIYYLASADYQDLKLKKSGGLDDARWFKLKDILDLNFYNDILPIITKAINLLLAKSEIKK
jgi:N utilization substance protein B